MRKSKADTVKGGVLAENQEKIDNADKAIKAALERKRRIIVESKLYTYDTLSELFGKEGQALIDAITAEHNLIGKLTASGMTYEQINELADDTDNGSDDVADGQTSFFEKENPYAV